MSLSACKKGYQQPSTPISDMSGYNDLQTEQFHDITIKEILAFADEKATAIIYCGYDSCPWCNCLVPVLNDVSIEKDMQLYYMDWMNDINKQDNQDMLDLVAYCGDLLDKNEDGDPVFFFPCVLYIKNGSVFNIHVGTVSGHDATSSQLSEKQQARLRYNLNKEFNAIIGL